MKSIVKTLGLMVAVSALTGCMLAPGPHYTKKPGWFSEADDEPAQELPDVVKVSEISTAVLSNPLASGDNIPSPPEPLQDEPLDYDYEVGPGDVLQITIWDHPELTIPAGSMRSPSESGNWVHNDGTIFYPYVGKVKVKGLKVTEIRDLIAKQISEYIEDPQVDVTVAAFRSKRVYMTGSVKKPGTYPVTNVPMRLLDAVNASGGLTPDADWSDVTLTRDGEDYRLSLRAIYLNGNPKQNILLKPGDVLHVARNDDNKVFVLGEVTEPQPVPMTRTGLSLAEALSNAGGFMSETANASGVFVMRKAQPGEDHLIDVYQLDANDATALVLADSFTLQRRDIVYVTAAPLSRWNRVIRQILPTAQTIYFGARAKDELENVGW